MTELWRAVPGYEGKYEVSSHGRVRSSDRTIETRTGVLALRQGQPLTPQVNADGYRVVWLSSGGRRVEFGVHRLVLMAFAGVPSEGQEACHNDGDPANNVLTNLRWGTRSDNTYDRVRHGTHVQSRKTQCPKGHAYDEANTYRTPSGNRRQCRTCKNDQKRERRAASKQGATT